MYPAHFAITDECGKRFAYYERFVREALGAGRASERALDVRADDWLLRFDGDRFVLHARSGGDALAFALTSEKRAAVHGRDGVSRKAACKTCASHYYSFTRLQTAGSLVVRGRRIDVSGISWMDHEFGSDELQADQAGWDWFSLQLDDGRELMLYRLRQTNGAVTPESSGSLIGRDGRVTHLALADFDVAGLATWRSPRSGAVYPSGWRVRVPKAGLDVVLAPVLPDQELAGTAGGISYWEGAVDVRTGPGQRTAGTGYVELTGYAGALSGF